MERIISILALILLIMAEWQPLRISVILYGAFGPYAIMEVPPSE